jgi:hypothetical protein
VVRERIIGRWPLPGVFPVVRGDRVSVHRRVGVWIVTRVKDIVWNKHGWAADCISAGIVPLGKVARREVER